MLYNHIFIFLYGIHRVYDGHNFAKLHQVVQHEELISNRDLWQNQVAVKAKLLVICVDSFWLRSLGFDFQLTKFNIIKVYVNVDCLR